MTVVADQATCSVQFDPIGKATFDKTGCDIAKSALAKAGIPYDNHDTPGDPVVRIGDMQLAVTDKASFDTALPAALEAAGYPAAGETPDLDKPLVVAILVSNLPESIGSASDLVESGLRKSRVVLLWAAVAVVCALATVLGFALTDAVGPDFRAVANGFAAGALLVMLVDSMVPEAQSKAKESTGLATVLGFAVAAWLALAV